MYAPATTETCGSVSCAFAFSFELLSLPYPQGRQPLFDDLATLDPELHKNLLMVGGWGGGCRTCQQ